MGRPNHKIVTILVENSIAERVEFANKEYGISKSAIYSKSAEIYLNNLSSGLVTEIDTEIDTERKIDG